MTTCIEKRRFVRAPVQLNVKCAASGKSAGENVLHFSTSDVSVGGIFVETREPFEPGARLDMEISLNRAGVSINACGAVLWRAKSSGGSLNGMGVELEFASDKDKKQLENFIIHELAKRL